MTFLRDPIWTFIGIIITILVFIATIILSIRQSKKELIYRIEETLLPLVYSETIKKIQRNLNSEIKRNNYLLMIKFQNIGKVDILAQDFELPLNIFIPNSKILNSEIAEVSPKSLKPLINTKESSVIINPLLLNRKDYFIIRLLLARYEGEVIVSGRIAGVRDIKGKTIKLLNSDTSFEQTDSDTSFEQTDSESSFEQIDWIAVSLGLFIVVAIGGLIPFWIMIYFTYR